MAYSAQAQEQFFRTVRIQVVEVRYRREWNVIQRDVVADKVVAVLSEYHRKTGERKWKPHRLERD